MYSKVSYKYRIKELLNCLPAKDRDIAMKNLPSYLNISRNTFSKILNCKENDSYEPAAATLISIAVFLDCPVEEMLTKKPDPITIEQLLIQNSSKVAHELSLSKK